MKTVIKTAALSIIALAAYQGVKAQDNFPETPEMEPAMTEFWTPQPTIVTPGEPDKNAFITAPSDAIILFDGKDLSAWQKDNGSPADWTLGKGYFEVAPHKGGIRTIREFEDFQLHIEWSAPLETEGKEGQGRGNSGIFMQGIYELQVLDSYGSKTYGNGQAGSIYKQTPPLVNAMRKPGEWNVYDVVYTAPRFKKDGSLQSHARITVIHNGVLIQNNTLILGDTPYTGLPKYNLHGTGPISLQDHGDKVKFRNIWIREL